MRIILLLIPVLLAFSLSAQIVDDSTTLVYGPETTKFTTGLNLLNNLDLYQNVDTSIYMFERQSYVNKSNRRFQNLGNLGTALYPVFHTPQKAFGRTSGFNAYTRYAYDPLAIRYYDTKSPFINLFVYLGGGNRNIVDVGFSRNVNENWNLGFDLRKITSNKQLAPESQTDRLVVGSSFTAYTHYKHAKVPYQFTLSYASMNHEVEEQGGVRPTSENLRSDFFRFDNALIRLDEAQGIAKIANWNLYHDFQIADQFQIYHAADYRKETNIFKDSEGVTAADGYNLYSDFYSNFFIDEAQTEEQSVFTTLSNEAGLKGDLSSVFYRFYARVRSVDWKYLFFDPNEKVIENYLGACVRFDWKEKFAVTGNAEYLLGGEYQFGGNLSSNLLDVSYRSMKYRVPFIFSDYFGNHHEWHNNFESIFSNELKGQFKVDFNFIEIRPKVSFTTYNNYVYFNEEIEPQQTSDPILISSLGGDFNLRMLNEKGEGWNLEHEALFTNVSGGGSDFVRVPDLFVNARYFWRGKWFGDLIPVEVGIDAHGRSSYFANAYAPEIQQFYLQNEQEVYGYVAADLFMNMQVDKFFFSLRWTHFNEPRNDGYFVTPNYPGQPKVIDIIVKWTFFD